MQKQIIKQEGLALIIFAVLVALAATAFFVTQLDGTSAKVYREKATASSLAKAKLALIGYATSLNLSVAGPRLGDMPCPDLNNDGIAEASCGSAAGSQQASRLGRFPWKTLGVDDLRDGYGERLWYVVSNNFKNNTPTTCTAMGQPGCLNSDSVGTITVRDLGGVVIKNGSTGTGAVAVIYSAGYPITRQDGINQDRSCIVGVNCNANDICTTTPASATPKCNPVNYLDILVGTEDNADFVDSSATNGFIFGPISDVSGATVLNDKSVVISTTELMPHLETRVANEALYCLKQYAISSGVDRHLWSTNKATAYPSFTDSSNNRFGRIPDTSFTQTRADSSNVMSASWPGSCKITSGSGWWLNWKELVFYAVAYDKDPESFVSPPCNDIPANDCLTVVAPSGAQNHKAAVVAVAGKALTSLGQTRSSNAQKQTLSNYLEGENSSIASGVNPDGEDTFFEQKPSTAIFNDLVVYY
jgi:hypothetical protein